MPVDIQAIATKEVFWTAIGSGATVLSVVVPLVLSVGRAAKRHLTSEIEPLKAENKRLRDEIDTRLRLPTFSLDAVKLTELAAQRRVEALEAEVASAKENHHPDEASRLAAQLQEVERLRAEIASSSAERQRLEADLQSALTLRMSEQSQYAGNAVSLPTGVILIVRYRGRFGAVLAVEQSGTERGAFARYTWWYQPDGTGRFTTASAQSGFAIASEVRPAVPRLDIGPIRIEWSCGGEGSGWVYFGPSSSPSSDYELLVTNESDVSRVDASVLQLLRASTAASSP